MRDVIASSVPPHWWERLRGAQFGFLAGLMLGLLLGWFFHGIISVAVRMGVLLLLLLPLLVIGWLWLRSQSGPRVASEGSVTMVSFETTASAQPEPPPPQPSTQFIDVPIVTREEPRQVTDPNEIERELERLKREAGTR